jgi:hypothetical protein
VRWQTKPIERRSIYVPSKSMPQVGVTLSQCELRYTRPVPVRMMVRRLFTMRTAQLQSCHPGVSRTPLSPPTASILCCTILPARATDLLPLLPTLKQGVLEMWVDIMKPEVASAFPPDDVSLPPTQMFEVNYTFLLVWHATVCTVSVG